MFIIFWFLKKDILLFIYLFWQVFINTYFRDSYQAILFHGKVSGREEGSCRYLLWSSNGGCLQPISSEYTVPHGKRCSEQVASLWLVTLPLTHPADRTFYIHCRLLEVHSLFFSRFPDITSVKLRMPNLHFLPLNLSSKDKPNLVKVSRGLVFYNKMHCFDIVH